MASRKKGSANESTTAVQLPEVLTITAAPDLKNLLLNMLDTSSGLNIDAKNVERITTPCVQILIAAANMCAADGKSFKLISPSPAFSDALTMLGLSSYLQSWSS